MRWCFSRQKSPACKAPATSMKTESSSRIEPRTNLSASILAGSPFSSAMEDGDDMMRFPHHRAKTGGLTSLERSFFCGHRDLRQSARQPEMDMDLHRFPQDFHRNR